MFALMIAFYFEISLLTWLLVHTVVPVGTSMGLHQQESSSIFHWGHDWPDCFAQTLIRTYTISHLHKKHYIIHARYPIWKSVYSNDGIFKGDPRGLSVAFCTDGVNPFSHNRIAYSMWPIMLTLLNLPREIRSTFGNIILLGIIPGNGSQEPSNVDPYLEVFIDELIQLSDNTTLFDSYQDAPFQLKVEILLYVLGLPRLREDIEYVRSGSYKGCLWCDIKGTLYYTLFGTLLLEYFIWHTFALKQSKKGQLVN